MMKVIILNPVFLRGSLSVCKLFHFPCRYKPQFLTLLHRLHYQSPQKVFCRNLSRLGVAFYSFDEMPGENNEENMKGTELLHLMEARGIRGNGQTYLWLLDCCSNSGSFIECMKLHGKIIKVGFDRESVLCDKLIDIYLEEGDLSCVIKVFDDMAERSVHTWNKVLSGFLEKKMSYRVLGLFSRMVEEDVSLSEITFSSVLRACVGADVEFSLVEQIHAKIICHGFFASPNVSNPLIDLYAKKGLLRSAEKVFSNLRSKDSVSWLAMISGYSQNGHEEEAVKLFCKMLASRNLTTPYVLSSVLSACTKRELFDIGEQLHALVFKQRFSSETYVCNALVTLYCRFGKFLSAEQVFSRMLRKDSVSYNSLISGLSQQGFSDKALELFEKMQADLLKPDCVTVASVLSACASTGALCKGEQLHAHVIKSGMSSDIIIEGALLDLYVKCSDVRTAHNFFLTTQTENVVLYNVMLVAYGQLDDLSESLFVFSQLQNRGLIPNEFTYPSILRTCTSVGALDLGEQIHTQVIKTGFQFNVYVCSVLIDMYAKNGKLDTARGILERLTEADVVSWTAMIAGCTQHELHSEALNYFKEMIERGIQSDNIGLSSAISACAGIQALSQGRQVHARSYVSGYAKDLSIGNALVILYARCGRTQEAYLAFEKIHARDGISWNALISGFVQCGHCEEALKVFVRMNRESVEASLFTFGSVVSAAANVANIKQGKQVHAMVIKSGFDSEIEVCNALITLYSKCGSINHAQREFSDMPLKNDVSWNAMITAYSQHGYAKEALNVFEKMKQAGQVPNHVTFVGVLSACSHVGLVDEGLGYFWSMSREHGLVPKPTHYACVVDLLSRAGFLSRARDFIEEMPIEPNATIWRTLLSFCTVYKNIEVGEFAACHLLELEPEDSATYVLLSNMYAVSGRWDHRDQTRKLMKDRGVKKEPGRSWIEVKNTIHAFFVGDKLHPLADKIYEYLADLNRRAAEIGYIQDQYSLLNESEQGVKDQTQYIHSEKLAITFGLLSLGKAEPIRVMKNLRVCNDCHNWIKFASKISDRPIVVRDAYRFHHFEGGVCSCGDYW